MEPAAALVIDPENAAAVPPVARVLEPARPATGVSPQRDRLERAISKRGWSHQYLRTDTSDGFTSLSLRLYDGAFQFERGLTITRRTDGFNEPDCAERLCFDLLDG